MCTQVQCRWEKPNGVRGTGPGRHRGRCSCHGYHKLWSKPAFSSVRDILCSCEMDDAATAGDYGSEKTEQAQEVQSAPPRRTKSLPEDLVGQILRWLPVTQALRCGQTSRMFQRAALASLQNVSWSSGAADCGTHGHSYCCYPRGVVGTPCLDLRAAGDSVDSQALLAVLGRVVGKPAASTPTAAVGREGGDSGQGEERGSTAAVGRPVILKGLAVCSAAIKDEVHLLVTGKKSWTVPLRFFSSFPLFDGARHFLGCKDDRVLPLSPAVVESGCLENAGRKICLSLRVQSKIKLGDFVLHHKSSSLHMTKI